MLSSDKRHLLLEGSSATQDENVVDRFWLVKVVMYLLGVGSLLPWNALITPIEYFQLRFSGSEFERSFESFLTITFTCVSTVVVLSLQQWQHLVSLRVSIVVSLLLLIAVFVILTALAIAPLRLKDDALLAHLSGDASTQFAIVIACSALCGIGQGVLTAASMSYAALFARPRYLQAVSVGQGLAGLTITLGSLGVSLPGIARDCAGTGAAAASSLATISPLATAVSYAAADGVVAVGDAPGVSHARDVVGAAAVYFGAAVTVLLCCLLGFVLAETLPFTRARKRLQQRSEIDGATGVCAGGGFQSGEGDGVIPLGSESLTTATRLNADHSIVNAPAPAPATSTVANGGGGGPASGEGVGTCELLATVWRFALSVCFIYSITIAIFPSLTSTIVAAPYARHANGTRDTTLTAPASPAARLLGHGVAFSGAPIARFSSHTLGGGGGGCEWVHLFVPLGFVIFNLGDTIGRNLPCLPRRPRTLLALCAARIVFAPLFMLCYTTAGGGLQLPLFWGSDALPLCIMLLFSLTNGWLTSAVFVTSQDAVSPALRGKVASLLVSMLNVGIFCGASLSFVVRYLDCTPSAANGFDCNPFISAPLSNASATLAA